MIRKILYLFLIVKISEARYNNVPKFYGQDSAIIIDTDKPLPAMNKLPTMYPTKMRLPPPFPLWRHFPRYHIIPPPPPGQILPFNTWPKVPIKPPGLQTARRTNAIKTTNPTTTSTTTSTTTTTTTTRPTTTALITNAPTVLTSSSIASAPKPINVNSKFRIDDEFPKELLDIAQNKLGLKSLDEIPSISELGQLLGTSTPQRTLTYIKQLTSKEEGVALLKAYIESTDYTDNAGDLDNNSDNETTPSDDTDDNNDDDDNEDENLVDTEDSLKVNDEGLVVISDEDNNEDYEHDNINLQDNVQLSTARPTSKSRETPKIISKLNDVKADKTGFFGRIVNYTHLNSLWHEDIQKDAHKSQDTKMQISNNKNSLEGSSESKEKVEDRPILVREPIPFNYPVPIRPQTSSTTTTFKPTTASSTIFVPNVSVAHLNTPKILIPHVQQLARATKISPQKIEDFLASKPKLLELANKVSRFPIGYDRNSPVEAQVMAAVQRALAQDDDLNKLLHSTATLK